MILIYGQCHCQKVKFQITPPTEFCSHCHCESCRKTHGAAFVTWTSVPNDQLKNLKGESLLNDMNLVLVYFGSAVIIVQAHFSKQHKNQKEERILLLQA